jgi:hypothetical protein
MVGPDENVYMVFFHEPFELAFDTSMTSLELCSLNVLIINPS